MEDTPNYSIHSKLSFIEREYKKAQDALIRNETEKYKLYALLSEIKDINSYYHDQIYDKVLNMDVFEANSFLQDQLRLMEYAISSTPTEKQFDSVSLEDYNNCRSPVHKHSQTGWGMLRSDEMLDEMSDEVPNQYWNR
jgi:hypothetical protein